ncbi:hypothetical protein AAFC00_003377 [Neodothiora populina]|uniref:Apple domain-containing protein n=1 Tax=Neodothiora populina TaxID=2781224 RepID=A0ABR3PE20_9PEZI
MSRSIFASAAVAALALTNGAAAQLFPLTNTTTASIIPGTVSSSTTSLTSSSSLSVTVTGTTTSTGGPSATTGTAAPTASDPVFCPALSGELYAGPLDVTYSISCDVNYGGVLIDISIAKRQNNAVDSLQDCLTLCSTLATCKATAFDTNNPECFFYSSIGEAFTANGFEFATVESRGAVSSTSLSSTRPVSSSNGTISGVTSGSGLPTGLPTGTGGSGPGFTSTGSVPYPTSGNSTTRSIPSTSGSSATSGSGVSTSGSSSGSATSGSATGSGTTSGTAPSSTFAGDQFCPALSGNIFIGNIGIQYLIECGVNHVGIIIDVTIAKRQGTVDSLGDCINQCDVNTACVATSFNTAAGTCTLFSSVGAAFEDPNSEFAMQVAPATTATAGQELTSTILSTTVRTISSCAPTVTDCPYAGGAVVVTEVIPVSETTYICPTATSFAAGPVVCTSCPYAPVTATCYSQTVETIYSCAPTVTDCPYNHGVSTAGAYGPGPTEGSGITKVITTTVTPVNTVVVNYPKPTGSGEAPPTMVTATGYVGPAQDTPAPAAGSGSAASGYVGPAQDTPAPAAGSGSAASGYVGPAQDTPAPAAGSGSAASGYVGPAQDTPAPAAGSGSAASASVGPAQDTPAPAAGTGSGSGSSAGNGGAVVTQIGDGQIQAPATGTATGTAPTMSSYTGAASQLSVGAGMAGAVVAGLAFLL